MTALEHGIDAGRDRARRLVLVIAEGATGSNAHRSVDPQPLLPWLIDEFDVVVLDTDAAGEYVMRCHFGGPPRARTARNSPLDPTMTGDLVEALSTWFGDDRPAVLHVQSGASSLYRLRDVFDAFDAALLVSIDGYRETQSVVRRWQSHLERVATWIVDSWVTYDHLAVAGSSNIAACAIVVPPASDAVPRTEHAADDIATSTMLRYGLVTGASAHATLLRAERLRALLPDNVELHIFGAAPGSSSPGILCHGELPIELLADTISRTHMHIVEVPEGRTGTEVRLGSLAAGAALLAHPTGTTAALIRRTGAGWVVDPQHLSALCALLTDLATHRFLPAQAMAAARKIKVPPVATHAAQIAEIYRDAKRHK